MNDPLIMRVFAIGLVVLDIGLIAGIVVLSVWKVAVPDALTQTALLVTGGLLGAFSPRTVAPQPQVVVVPPLPPATKENNGTV